MHPFDKQEVPVDLFVKPGPQAGKLAEGHCCPFIAFIPPCSRQLAPLEHGIFPEDDEEEVLDVEEVDEVVEVDDVLEEEVDDVLLTLHSGAQPLVQPQISGSIAKQPLLLQQVLKVLISHEPLVVDVEEVLEVEEVEVLEEVVEQPHLLLW